MSYPQQPWQQPPGQPSAHYQNGPNAPAGWPQNTGMPAPPPRINFGTLDQTKLAAGGVAVAAAVVLLGSLFSLYTVTVTPSGAAVRNNDAPGGTVGIGIGFFDVVPFPPPIVATAIPMLMLLAALTAAPALFGRGPKVSVMPAVFAGTAAVLSIVLAISNPLPTVNLTGELASEFREEVEAQSIGQLIDSVVAVSPGPGLIIAALFAVAGWAAAVVMLLGRTPRGQMPFPAAGHPPPGTPPNPYNPGPPNTPTPW